MASSQDCNAARALKPTLHRQDRTAFGVRLHGAADLGELPGERCLSRAGGPARAGARPRRPRRNRRRSRGGKQRKPEREASPSPAAMSAPTATAMNSSAPLDAAAACGRAAAMQAATRSPSRAPPHPRGRQSNSWLCICHALRNAAAGADNLARAPARPRRRPRVAPACGHCSSASPPSTDEPAMPTPRLSRMYTAARSRACCGRSAKLASMACAAKRSAAVMQAILAFDRRTLPASRNAAYRRGVSHSSRRAAGRACRAADTSRRPPAGTTDCRNRAGGREILACRSRRRNWRRRAILRAVCQPR